MAAFESFAEWDGNIQNAIAEDGLSQEISILHINIRSIRKHWDQLCVYLSRNVVTDVIVLTEVNVDATRQTCYDLDGYQKYALCRENRRGGGVFIYVKDAWICSRIDVNFQNAEVIALSINKREETYILCGIYRPPSKDTNMFLKELSPFLQQHMNEKQLLLVGDLNIDILQEARSAVADYLNLLAEYGLMNVINAYTREEHLGCRITKTCIDHIVLRLAKQSYRSGVVNLKLADHYFIVAVIFSEKNVEGEESCVKRDLLDNKKVDELIKKTNWSSLLALDHLKAYNKLVQIFQDIYDRSTRCVTLKQRNPDNKWMTHEIMNLCYIKDQAWKTCRKKPEDDEKRREFRMLRNLVTAKIRQAKRRYFLHQFTVSKYDVSMTWKIANELMGRSKHASIEDTVKRNFPNQSLRTICDKFNDTFITAAEILRESNDSNSDVYKPVRACAHTAFLPPISETDLWRIMRQMKLVKPPGIDKVRFRDLYIHFNELKEVMLKILNGILETGVIPQELKISIIRPVYKSGKRDDYTNYRPIAILCAIAQIIEKHIAYVMQSFCEKFSLHNPAQFGFTKNRNTIALLEEFSD